MVTLKFLELHIRRPSTLILIQASPVHGIEQLSFAPSCAVSGEAAPCATIPGSGLVHGSRIFNDVII